MTVYKALAAYLKTKQSDLSIEFYPAQAPESATTPFCVFKIIDDSPTTIHDGTYPSGSIIVQFDIYSKSLTEVDDRADQIKDLFVAKSIPIHADVEIGHANSQNEFDDFDDEEKMYIRSFDLRMTYLKS